ncbi:hypothetical protein [Paenibacillus paeoniae]|uniref:Uncharacterized protein n=1 Tax=Paenibacillus paeoniae TaxID=2292705 RepID=A0A371P057_9BACL|nr:hypothetical protein [Paenibacillus paeoniae]REK69322.1 hypothetical protein DX130_24485 [Paenibacillus paeoniae]
MNPYDFYITPEEYAQAAEVGISAFSLERRIRLLGWSKQRAMTMPMRTQKPRGYYDEWAKTAQQNGIKYESFMTRIRQGWTPERAATKSLQSADEARRLALRATDHVRVHPEKYLRLAEQNGIPYATFHRRVKVSKWNYERAATEPIWTRQQIGRLGAQRLRKREGG